jgi:hypothetical protein
MATNQGVTNVQYSRRCGVAHDDAGHPTGCAAASFQPSIADLPSRELKGHLITTERAYWFQPCDSEPGTRWWVTFTGTSVDRLEQAKVSGEIRAGTTSFVRWNAALTDERFVGPGGPALLVREIMETRRLREGENACLTAASASCFEVYRRG